MTVAVASGKGGTGKTTVAVSLALAAKNGARLLDCDVEEPNCHIFLEPESAETETVNILIPEVNESLCTSCGICGSVCQYSAIVSLKTKPLIFPELCHSCGACVMLCPEKALYERKEPVGEVCIGKKGSVDLVYGKLNVGKALPIPVIRAVKEHISKDLINIIDCPPGTSCPVISAVKGSDIVVLVTEPTPFGFNDLRLAVDTMRTIGHEFAVLINRSDTGTDDILRYCENEGIEILASIPNSRRVAEDYSHGRPPFSAFPEYSRLFSGILEKLANNVKPGMKQPGAAG